MPLLKKVHDSWSPIENPGIKTGEVMDFPGNIEALVKTGMAVLVDEAGNELELPGIKFSCPVCFTDVVGLSQLMEHISQHLSKSKKSVPVSIPETPEATTLKKSVEAELEKQKSEDLRARRIAVLAKARLARKAKNAKA